MEIKARFESYTVPISFQVSEVFVAKTMSILKSQKESMERYGFVADVLITELVNNQYQTVIINSQEVLIPFNLEGNDQSFYASYIPRTEDLTSQSVVV